MSVHWTLHLTTAHGLHARSTLVHEWFVLAYRSRTAATKFAYSCSPGFLGNRITRVTALYQTLFVKGRCRETNVQLEWPCLTLTIAGWCQQSKSVMVGWLLVWLQIRSTSQILHLRFVPLHFYCMSLGVPGILFIATALQQKKKKKKMMHEPPTPLRFIDNNNKHVTENGEYSCQSPSCPCSTVKIFGSLHDWSNFVASSGTAMCPTPIVV